jgi:hypothetical protein
MKKLLIISAGLLIIAVIIAVYVTFDCRHKEVCINTGCLFKNCETHSCEEDNDCSDVWCPYMGAILGGNYYSHSCGPTQECITEATQSGLRNNGSTREDLMKFREEVDNYCSDRKVCMCNYY